MKTAISIPDAIFEQAEELAQKQGLSRSELYTKAICTISWQLGYSWVVYSGAIPTTISILRGFWKYNCW
jgi:hypothetical protein